MAKQHPITPPPELVQQWVDMLASRSDHAVFTMAAQWGADQELEACCEWFTAEGWNPCHPTALRATRRPKPPSLKERALHELNDVYNKDKIDDCTYGTIRAALEALDD